MARSFEGTPIASWGSFQPQPVSTVPSSQAASVANASASTDPLIRMVGEMGPAVSERDIQAAITPIAGAHAARLPSSLTTPVQPHQDAPLDYRPVVGAGNARARGIGNTITAVMNGLGRVVTAEAQNKQNQVRDAATKVITAQQAIDEAQQQLDMAMQSGDTATVAKMKDIIQKNTSVRDGVFSDPKMRKALAKGFNMNYIDPTQNKTSEHAAVQQAIKGAKTMQERKAAIQALQQKQNAEAGAAAGKAWAAQQPRGLAANTEAQAKLQVQMETQKNATDIIKSVQPAIIRAQGQERAALINQATALREKSMQIDNQNFQRAQAFQNRMKYLTASDALATRRMFVASRLMVKRAFDILGLKGASPDLVQKTALQSARQWDSEQSSAQARLASAMNNLSLYPDPSNPAYANANAAVEQAQSNLEMIQQQAAQALDIYNLKLAEMGLPTIPGPAEAQVKKNPNGGSPDAATTAQGTGNNFLDYLGNGASPSSEK